MDRETKKRGRIHRSLIGRFTITAFIVCIVLAATFGRAQAHAALVRSDPADNSILAQSPHEVRLWFNEAISAEFSTARVLDINGKQVQILGLHRDDSDHELLILALPDLEPGVYSINWNVLSESDGHTTQGLVVFGVGEEADLGAAASTKTQDSVPPVEAALRWLNFGLLAALVGVSAILLLVLTWQHSSPPIWGMIAEARQRMLSWAIYAGVSGALVWFALFAWQVFSLRTTVPENVSIIQIAIQLLVRTRWGILWVIRQAAYLGIIWSFRSWRISENELIDKLSPRAGDRLREMGYAPSLTVFLAMVLVILQALNGHSASVTPNTGLAIIVDFFHLLGASFWIGGLLALVIGLLPIVRRREDNFSVLVRAGWGNFGPLAALSVAVIIATGLYNTGRQVATVDALISSLYGWVLLSKVAIMVGVGLIGLLNSMMLHPKLAAPLGRILGKPSGWTPVPLRRLPTLVLVEAASGVFIFLAVGILTSAPPARGPEYPTSADQQLETVHQNIDDLLVTFSAKPNLPGQNVFSIRAASSRRPPPAETLRVIVHFTYLGEELGTVSVDADEVEPNSYRLGGNYFSLAGPYKVEVAVRRKGLEDSVATFQWNVLPPGASKPVIISNDPLEPVANIAATGFIVLVAVITAIVAISAYRNRFRRRRAHSSI